MGPRSDATNLSNVMKNFKKLLLGTGLALGVMTANLPAQTDGNVKLNATVND